MIAIPKVLKALALSAVIVAVAAPLLSMGLHAESAPEAARRLPPPAVTGPASAPLQTAVLAGGCFWGVQGVFAHVKGVKDVVSGYAGGAAMTAHYEMVSTGTTGHAESVKITFDPKRISYGQILQLFFSVATDPTQLNHQYPDEGAQYRSEIFYTDEGQKAVADAYIAQLNQHKAFRRPIVTRVDPLKAFYPAEGYHQNYLTLHPDEPYIAMFDIPKVEALKSLFPEVLQPAPLQTAVHS